MGKVCNDATLLSMRRRSLMKVGLAGGVLLALAGASWPWCSRPAATGKLHRDRAHALHGTGAGCAGRLAARRGAARRQAMAEAFVPRVEEAINGMPPAMQAEVDELLTIAGSSVGRVALVGLGSPWATASAEQIQSALRGMRDSSLALRQQAYHALRDLTNGGYFADESAWAVMGYAGQRPV
jgi:hypothetical protein